MSKHCKKFKGVLSFYKKEIDKRDALLRLCLSFMDSCYYRLDLPPSLTNDYGDLSICLEELLGIEREEDDGRFF